MLFLWIYLISIETILSIDDDCGTYNYVSFSGKTFVISTKEICTAWSGEICIFGLCCCNECLTSKCEPDDSSKSVCDYIVESETNIGWDMNKCKTTYDGCSVPQDLGGYPEYETIFKSACNIHDACYSNKDFTATECDQMFFYNMNVICFMTFPERPEGDTLAEKTYCLGIAASFAVGVLVGGNNHPRWSGSSCYSVSPVFQHIGDCNVGGNEVYLGDAENIFECQSLCINKYGSLCVYFTIESSGSGRCYWEESCSSHNSNTAWKGYKVASMNGVNVVPLYIPDIDDKYYSHQHDHYQHGIYFYLVTLILPLVMMNVFCCIIIKKCIINKNRNKEYNVVKQYVNSDSETEQNDLL